VGWDYTNQNFTFAEEGTTAKVKVAVNYGDCIGNWKYHDGSVMSLADWIVPWIIDYEQANPESPLYDPATLPEFNSEKSSLKGTRIVSESPLIIEYYTDYITREAEFIYEDVADRCGINARQYAQYPWQNMAIGIKAEAEGLLAFSADKSEELDVEWMNYIGGPSLPILENVLQEAMDTEWIPFENVLSDYVSSEDIQTRYQNLKNWYDDKGHFKVAGGQFYLDQVDFVGHSAVIKAFRDYPFKADKFSRLAEPPIPVATVEVPENVIPSLGAIINYDLSYEEEPYANDRMELAKYMVLDSLGNVITVGNAEPIAEGKWIIGLDSTETARLTAGAYNLVTIALSKDVAMPGIVETPFVVMPDLLTYFDALLAQKEAEISAEIEQLDSSIADNTQALGELKDSVESIEIPTGVEELESKISSLNTTTYAALAVAVIAVLVAAYGFMSKK
jgi:peptide/nickel transport system substrate-binding protein